MACPVPPETEEIEKLRTRLSDLKLDTEQNSDYNLMRWLRAREGNLDNAEAMFRSSYKWRQKYDISSLIDWVPPEHLTKHYRWELIGYDRESSPVVLLRFGSWDLKKLMRIGQKNTYIKYVDHIFEVVMEAMKGKTTPEDIPVTQFVVIFDVANLQMRTLASYGVLEAVAENVRRFEMNHPETLKSGIVINANRVFHFLFSFVKPLLSPRTFGKVQIFTTQKEKWQPVLLKYIAEDNLPTDLGGNIELEEGDDDYTEVDIKAGSSFKFPIPVEKPKTEIRWAFETINHDITFSLRLDGKSIIVKEREPCAQVISEGSHLCETPGNYELHFDNSYSRFRAKVLKYKVDVIPPQSRESSNNDVNGNI